MTPAPALSYATYYIDPDAVRPGDGSTPALAAREHDPAWLRPGVTLLYRRGRVVRGAFPKWSGTAEAWARVGAYGEGPRPVFMKSIGLASPTLWHATDRPNVWRCSEPLTLCANLIFDDAATCGAKRWKPEDLREQGDWYNDEGPLLLWSEKHPAEAYNAIEFVPAEHFIAFEEGDGYFAVEGVGICNAGIHGFWVHGGHHLVFRDCDVSYIGGAVFPSTFGVPEGLIVRYGNAFEVWDAGHDVLLERCRIFENYDAGAALQGLPGSTIRNVVIRDNVFWNNGFDTFDWSWGVVAEGCWFEHNTCIDTGGGWAYETEGRPRLSAFLPDAVGWHVFFTHNTQPADITIRYNLFHHAERNRLVHLHCDRGALARIVMDHNGYWQGDPQDPYFSAGERIYTAGAFAEYRRDTGFDAHSVLADPRFVDARARDYRLRADSPYRGLLRGVEPTRYAIDVPHETIAREDWGASIG